MHQNKVTLKMAAIKTWKKCCFVKKSSKREKQREKTENYPEFYSKSEHKSNSRKKP